MGFSEIGFVHSIFSPMADGPVIGAISLCFSARCCAARHRDVKVGTSPQAIFASAGGARKFQPEVLETKRAAEAV
jgi:hypothetical protein